MTDEGLNQAVTLAEPVLKPIGDYLGVKSDLPPPPKTEEKKPTVWVGKPPIDVRLQQRREQKAAQDALDQTEPGALAPPIKKNATQDVPQFDLTTPDEPGVTTLPDGQKVVIPPKPPFEITEDIKYEKATLASANVQGVRAAVVHNLNHELRVVEGNAEMSRSAAARFLNDWPIMRRLADFAGGAEPPSQSIWIDVDKNIEKAHKAIVEGDLPSAAELTKAARKSLRNAQATWGRYTDKNLGGAENIKTVAEGTRDAAKYTLIVLAVAASGGTALAVATAGSIAIDLADVAARAALGEPINWADVTVDIAIQVITAKFGGKLSGSLMKSVLKNPAAQGIERRILTQAIEGLITGAESRTLATSIRGLFGAASFDHRMMTWDQFIDQIADPKSVLIDIILGAARGIQAKQQASPFAKAEPTPDKSQTAGGKKSQAKPPTNDYDVEAWEKYYKENPEAKRSVGAAQRGDPLFSDYSVIHDDEGVNIPPETAKTRVEDRPRGSAIEDRHLDARPDYSRPKEHNFPGIDAWKGGRERTVKTATGEKRIIYGADVLQVKSIDRSSAEAIQRRVREGIDGLDPNEFELKKGTTRVVNPRSRRLDVIFEEGVVLDLNAENRALLRRLSAEAGSKGIEVRWFKFVGDREVPIPIH